MHAPALVQLEQAVAVGLLDDADVLVLGVLLEDHLAVLGRLDRPDRDRERRRDQRRRQEIAPGQAKGADQRQHHAEDDERALRSRERDQDERREHGAQERADRRDRIEAPGDRTGVLDLVDAQADRPGRDGAQDGERDRDQEEDGEEGADEGSRLDLVEGRDRHLEERLGDERDQRQEKRARRSTTWQSLVSSG